MSGKAALLIVGTGEVVPHVESIVLPAVRDHFAEIAIGSDFAAFAPVLARHDRFVLACGFAVPDLRALTSEILAKSPRARPVWIHAFSAGVGHLTTAEVRGCGAPVTNAKGCFSQSLAEFVLFGCMYFDKEVPRLQANRAAARWERYQMGELAGQTMGIVGYGSIGQTTGALAKAFQMEVLAYRRSAAPSDGVAEMCAGDAGLDRLLRDSDFVVAAMPDTPETRHFMNAERIAKMKPTAVLLNVGRGTCVDEAALHDALKHQRIRGAALDVFEKEPLAGDSPLWTLDNILMSPHIADNTKTYYSATLRKFVRLVADCYVPGKPFGELVDLDKGY